jgi:hypothetical protein
MNASIILRTAAGFQKARKIVKSARIGLCGVAGSGQDPHSPQEIACGLGKRIIATLPQH